MTTFEGGGGGGGVVNWEKPLILLYHIKQLTAGEHEEICDKMWGMVQKWLGTTALQVSWLQYIYLYIYTSLTILNISLLVLSSIMRAFYEIFHKPMN